MALPTISSNSPSAGSISWTGFGLQYDGVSYEIPAGSTDKKFTWWDYSTAVVPESSRPEFARNLFPDPRGTDHTQSCWRLHTSNPNATLSTVAGFGEFASCIRNTRTSTGETRIAMIMGANWSAIGDLLTVVLHVRASAGASGALLRAQTTATTGSGGYVLWSGSIPAGESTIEVQATNTTTNQSSSTSGISLSWTGGDISDTVDITGVSIQVGNSAPLIYLDGSLASDGNLAYFWIGVENQSPSVAVAAPVISADTLPELAPEDLLLFLNRNGVGVLAPTAQVVDGSLIVSGSIIGDAIAANQIDAYHVKAGAITANAIAAGAVQAEALAAGVITTSKLSVGTISDNAVANGSFEDGTEGWTSIAAGAGASADVVTGVASAGSNALRLVRGTSDTDLSIGQHPDFFIPVSSAALRRWYINARAGAASALAAGFNLIAYWWQADKTTPSAISPATAIATDEALSTSWSDFEGQVTVPSDAHWMQIAIVNSLSGSTMFVDEVTALEVVVSAMIGDGEISAAKLAAGSVEAEAIAAGAVSAEAIAAGAIQANHIEAGSINVSHLSPSVGENLDLSANGSITSLAGQVNLIATDVGDTADQVSSMATALVVTPTNVQIVNSNSSYSFVITPEGAQITEGGVARASWDAGRMVVPSMVVDGAIIGNHKWEKSGSGTIVRAL